MYDWKQESTKKVHKSMQASLNEMTDTGLGQYPPVQLLIIMSFYVSGTNLSSSHLLLPPQSYE